jgi:hypothetical protein
MARGALSFTSPPACLLIHTYLSLRLVIYISPPCLQDIIRLHTPRLHHLQHTMTATKGMHTGSSYSDASSQQSDATVVTVHWRRLALPPTTKNAPAAAKKSLVDPCRQYVALRAKDQKKEEASGGVTVRQTRRAKRVLGDLSDYDQDDQPASKKPRIKLNTRSVTRATDKHSPSSGGAVLQHPRTYDFSSIPESARYLVDDKIQLLCRLLKIPQEEVL